VTNIPLSCVKAFAVARHGGISFSFLKENGELLAIANSCGLSMSSEALGLYAELYDKIDKLCHLYPPFHRFFMAIALDLEDLGMPGQKGTELLDYVVKHKFYAADTSDTRRMEIINLLSRRGRVPNFEMDSQKALLKRVIGFLEKPNGFIKFNRPLFYEFTHLIFYITDYGQDNPPCSNKIFQSLNHIGMLAYLDNDIDLLAEVCLCYIFLKRPAPEIWIKVCASGLRDIHVTFKSRNDLKNTPPTDDYHIYFVNNWLMSLSGKEAFQEDYKNGVPIFTHQKAKKSTLSKIFQVLHPMMLENTKMSSNVLRALDFLSVEDTIHLKSALSISPNGDEFFNKLTNGHISVS